MSSADGRCKYSEFLSLLGKGRRAFDCGHVNLSIGQANGTRQT